MQTAYTAKAKKAIDIATRISKSLHHSYIGTEHILLGLLKEGTGVASQVLADNGVEYDKVLELIEELIAPGNAVAVLEDGLSPRAAHVLEVSKAEAARFHSEKIGTEHLLIAMIKETECVASRLLNTLSVNVQKMYVDTLIAMGEDVSQYKDEFQNGKPGKRRNAEGTPALDQFSRDLTELARAGKLDPVVGRETEIDRVIQILSRRSKNNPCLIGEPGVGKTAIVEGIAERIAGGMVPDTVLGKRVVSLDLSGIVAGSKYRGEFEERIKKVLAEVAKAGNVLLFIDEIHTIIGAGGAEGAIDASIIKGLRGQYESHHHVTITDEAVEAAVRLSARYINDRFLPDKAIDLMDEAAAKVRLHVGGDPKEAAELRREIAELQETLEEALSGGDLETARESQAKRQELEEKLEKLNTKAKQGGRRHHQTVGEDEIADVVSGWTKIPVKKLTEGEAARLKKLEATLHKRVIGQEEAVSAVAKAVRRGRVGLKDPKRPIGSFLFLGPTGVGKTEISKALAEAVFGQEQAMIRIDMSEYMEKHSVSKMIGSPPGYVGHEDGGQLSEKVRRNPYAVILFDEIEKAHPDVFNILLQVLDDGHITDSQGRKVDFKNTIIIMTSNAGAQAIVEPKKLGFASGNDEKQNYERMKGSVMEEVRRIFKPEFLNRIDETIVFRALNKDDMKQIVGLMTKELAKRCETQLGITLVVRDAAKQYIVDKAYDPKYGARPLRRKIQDEIEDPLAEKLLDGSIRRGDEVIVTTKKNAIFLESKKK